MRSKRKRNSNGFVYVYAIGCILLCSLIIVGIVSLARIERTAQSELTKKYHTEIKKRTQRNESVVKKNKTSAY
ncbi:hypothetical protein BTHER_01315 [Brochothrix thermosphacta DSM 20171 = FSL F6-1036]|nr:hypothetical protein BTHER_01315 [Brochothrix thermosphacta DSM 20171 = FSL F6-1036]